MSIVPKNTVKSTKNAIYIRTFSIFNTDLSDSAKGTVLLNLIVSCIISFVWPYLFEPNLLSFLTLFFCVSLYGVRYAERSIPIKKALILFYGMVSALFWVLKIEKNTFLVRFTTNSIFNINPSKRWCDVFQKDIVGLLGYGTVR